MLLLCYFWFPKFPYFGNRKSSIELFYFYFFFLLVTIDFLDFWKTEHYRHNAIFGFFKFPKVFGRFKNGHKKYVHFLFSQKSLGKWKMRKISLKYPFKYILYLIHKYIILFKIRFLIIFLIIIGVLKCCATFVLFFISV